jgi:amino acid transporter
MAEQGTSGTQPPSGGSTAVDADTERLARFGYRQELSRVLTLFENFSVAFCYLSPVVGIYSLFVLGAGAAGPRYIWLMPFVVLGQLMVALVFAELGSHYPIAGALFQWGKNLIGSGYGWWVGWMYGWALLVTVAAVDTGIVPYASNLSHDLFKTNFNIASPNVILLFTVGLLALQTIFNIVGVNFLGSISRIGTYVEILGTFGIAILLAAVGYHHGVSFLWQTRGAQYGATNSLGVDFHGSWLAAAMVAVLAHVYIFYGFESAGDVAEEVVDAGKRVPKAMISALLIGGLASFVLVAGLLLAIPSGAKAYSTATSFAGGVPFIVNSNVTAKGAQDVIYLLICFAFFSCGLAVQGAGARLAFSYARDGALPGSSVVRKVSPRFKTPVNAILLGAIVPLLFVFLVHYNPSKPVHILWFNYPPGINALLILVSFGVSGIYISFFMIVIAALIARLRGWKPEGHFKLGKWAYPVIFLALAYQVFMLINILLPSGDSSPRAVLFNFNWLTLVVVMLIVILGAIYYLIARPAKRVAHSGKTDIQEEQTRV